MITRFVPSCPGSSGPGATDLDEAGGSSNQLGRATRASAPEDVLRQAHAASLAGIFNQIGEVIWLFRFASSACALPFHCLRYT